MKTSELTGEALNWAVAQAAIQIGGFPVYMRFYTDGRPDTPHWGESGSSEVFRPSTNWAHGGPIIEQEGIELLCNLTAAEATRFESADADWQAFHRSNRSTDKRQFATTPLVAAMRCFVASRLGDEVDIPEELTP